MSAGPPSPAPPARQHLYWIDALRFLAAFADVAEHARAFNWRDRFPMHDSVHPFARSVFYACSTFGNQAVVIFFVLSGWLVGGSVLAKVRAGTFDATAYAADRLSRVYVPLVPALLLTAAAVRALDAPFFPGRLLACLVGWQGIYTLPPGQDSPLWTLAYEMWFYALAGCVAIVCQRASTRPRRILAGLGAALAAAQCLQLEWAYCACWLLGVAGPWVRDRLASRPRGVLAVTSGGVLLAAAVVYQMEEAVLPGGRPWMPPLPAIRLIIAGSALLFTAAVADLAPRTDVGRRLERAGTSLAAFSYTLYLTHYPVIWALAVCLGPMPHMLDFPSTLRYAEWLAVSLGVALGMYGLFEARTPQVRRWLRSRLAALPGPTPSLGAVGKNFAAAR